MVESGTLEAFNDKVIELEQYKHELGLTAAEVKEDPDCLGVFFDLCEIVVASPDVISFYADALKSYRKTQPDSVKKQRDVIASRLHVMFDLDLFTERRQTTLKQKLDSGTMVYDEARVFFKLFKSLVDPRDIPKDRYAKKFQKSKARPKSTSDTDNPENDQARTSDTESGAATHLQPQVATYDVQLMHSESSGESEESQKVKGWEYDELVNKYGKHRLNREDIRYARDFRGFNGQPPKPLYFTDGDSIRDDASWFSSHMRRFPLLDGLEHERVLKNTIEDGLSAMRLLQSPDDIDPLEIDQLQKRAIYGAGAFQTMYECNLRLVMKYARKYYTNAARDVNDVIQDGCEGLRRAIQLFDPKKGFKFSTYASYWIKQKMSRSDAKTGYLVTIPPKVLNDARSVQQILNRDTERFGSKVSDEELIAMGYTEETIYAARHLLYRTPVSLDAPFGDGNDNSLYDVYNSEDVDFDRRVESSESAELLRAYLESIQLSDKEKIIFSLRNAVVVPDLDYNQIISFPDGENISLLALLMEARKSEHRMGLGRIGDALGYSRERVRQVDNDIKEQLLNEMSIQKISKRLHMDEDEVTLLKKYLSRRHLVRRGRRSNFDSHTIDTQKQVNNLIDVLSLVDATHEEIMGLVRKKLEVLYAGHDDLVDKICLWLDARFNPEYSGDRPVGRTKGEMSNYAISNEMATSADHLYIAMVADSFTQSSLAFEQAS